MNRNFNNPTEFQMFHYIEEKPDYGVEMETNNHY